jgi:O-antigen ligase
MAATTIHSPHPGVGAGSWLVVAVAMLALALGCGYTLALGELAGLYVGLSLVCAVAVLFDFRVGAVLLLLMLPMSASTLFPHGLMGITGLNPLNLLALATLAAYVIHGRTQAAGALVPQPLVWLFMVPIILAGLLGMDHVKEIPSFFYELETVTFYTGTQYLMAALVKPIVIVAVALLIGAAAARSQKPERFIVAIAVSAWFIALIQIGFVISVGAPLAAMAATESRNFYAPLGMHPNQLGRLHVYALALLLFVWAETKRPETKLFLLITICLLGVALLFTFSRTCFGAAALVGAAFVMFKFNMRSLSLVFIGLALLGAFGLELLYLRLSMGFGEGADAVSAGRIEGIWLPLLPELAKNPVFGNGLGSTMWSFPMLNGAMVPVGHPHNAYLEALLDMGIVGFALLMAFYVHVWRGFRALGSNAWLDPQTRGLFQGAMAALVAFFVTGLTGGSLKPDEQSAYLWVAIGLMYGLRSRKPTS